MIAPKRELASLGFGPLKKLGQNFLVNESSAEKIYRFAEIPKNMPVLEIGPGLGAMSLVLAKHGHPLTLVEKDSRLIPVLEQKLPQANIYNEDVLNWAWPEPLLEKPKGIYVLSNLPYQVATPIMEMLFQKLPWISGMSFLMQKEMVSRICASPGVKNYGRLSIWTQCMSQTLAGPSVGPGSFFPPPAVESQLLRLSPREHMLIPFEEQPAFFKFVSRLFVKRRKMIRSILELKEVYIQALDPAIGKQLTRRPESLDVSELHELFLRFAKA